MRVGSLVGVSAKDDYATTNENTPVAINVLANDQTAGGLPGDSLHVQSVTQPPDGAATINPDNTVTYSPKQDFYGSDSFQYGAADQTGLLTGSATVHITVNAISSTTTVTSSETSTTTTTTTTTSTSSSFTTSTSSTTTSTTSVVGGITVYAHRIPATYWDPCFATECSEGSGPGVTMYFVLQDSSGNVIQTGYADENGYTFTGLTPGVTYYVYPDDCTGCHGSTHDVVFDHWGDGSNVRPLETTVGSSLDAWYSCTNGCSGP